MTTTKRRLTIQDDYGAHVAAVYAPADSVDFEYADIGGLALPFSKALRGHSFRGANLYWSSLAGADLTGCTFDEADLRGSNLDDSSLRSASLRGTKLGLDNLGGPTRLCGADLTEACLDGAELRGALYDSRTIFPNGFSPVEAGMVEHLPANNSLERSRER